MAKDTEMVSILRELDLQHHRKQNALHAPPVRESLRFHSKATSPIRDSLRFRNVPAIPEAASSEWVFQPTQEQPRTSRMALAKWFMVLLCGATLSWFALQFRAAPAPSAEVAGPAATEAAHSTLQSAEVSTGFSGAANGGTVTPEGSAFTNRLRGANVLELLGDASGHKPAIQNLNTIAWREGKSIKVSVLLYAMLDERTERNWREAGLFKSALDSPQPFVKNVTIASAEQLDLLRDWHVEGVLHFATGTVSR